MPRHCWCDAHSIDEVVSQTMVFNAELQSKFPDGRFRSYTAAADMIDCFHHLPVCQVLSIWDDVASYWRTRGVGFVSVARQSKGGAADMGKYDMPGFSGGYRCLFETFLRNELRGTSGLDWP